MNFTLPVLLWLLCLTDAGFCGYRDAAGRDARIFKAELYRRAVRAGLGHGMLASFWVALGVGAVIATSAEPAVRYAELLVCARAMLWILLPYATLLLVGMGVWAAGEADLRTLASVALLGPFTLTRPWVIAGAGAFAAWKAPSATSAWVAMGASALQLGIEPWLGRKARWPARPP